MKKRILSMILVVLIIVMVPFTALAAEDEDAKKNVCLKKPISISSSNEFDYGWGVYTICANDGDWSTRTCSGDQKTYGNYQWYLIDLCANYTISEVLLGVSAGGGVPKSLAVDVYSGGKWVRVAQQYDLAVADFPLSLYFDELDCSYIQISTNEECGFLGFTEIQAYHTMNISEKEKKDSYEKKPSGGVDIPMPSTVSDYLFKQGLKSDQNCNEAIPNAQYLIKDAMYRRNSYTDADVAYLKTIYSDEELSEIMPEEVLDSFETVEKLQVQEGKEQVDIVNPLLLCIGITFSSVAVFFIILNVIKLTKSKKKIVEE